MPSTRTAAGAATAPAVPLAVRLLRLAANTIVLLVAVFCALLLVIRFVAFPRIEAHHDDIAAMLSKRIGQQVGIAGIATGWDGWNPRLSIRGFTVADRADASTTVLDLPRVDLVVAWTSLFLVDLKLKELAVEGPRLAVRRDPAGLIHVAGIAIDPAQQSDDNAVTDWLLRQRRIVVHDGLVIWTDELRKAPQLVLDQVDLRIEHGFGHHRFGLTGVPPAEVAAPLDLRGEFSAATLRDWRTAHGRAYLRLDYADLGAWREWLPLPVGIESGKGALRVWFEFSDGTPRAITADIELADVKARLAPDLPPVDLTHVAGRVGGRQEEGHREIYTRALTFTARDGTSLPGTDFQLRHDAARDGTPARGEMSFDRLDVAPVSGLAGVLPLPERWRQDLARFAPHGTVKDGKLSWEGPADAPQKFRASAQFAELGMSPYEAMPGFTGLTGRFEATEAKGTITLENHALTLALPRVFAAPLAFDTASARVGWSRSGEAVLVRVDEAAFANADAAGTASGTWHSEASGPGTVDIRGQLTRARVEPVQKYLPLRLNESVRTWLARALVKGTSNDVRLTLRGNLADFPFPQGRNGQFVVAVKGRDATLDFADGWPAMSDVEADLRFEGSRMTIDAARGRVLGANVGRTRVEIPDMREHPALLKVDGEADGATGEFLAFVAKSPVGDWINHASDSVQATGNGHLALKFELPLGAARVKSLAGEYQLVNNQVRWTGAPPLAQVNGKLAFTDRDLASRDLLAEVLGGPMKLALQTSEGRVRVTANGTANVALLRQAFDAPLVDRMTGTADWQLTVDSRADAIGWSVESSLKGAAVDLPAPLGKAADDVVPLRIVRREVRAGREDSLTFDYGRAARIVMHRQLAAGETSVDRALVLLGKAMDRPAEPPRSGLWIRADLPSVNVDDWLAFQRKLDARPVATPAAGGGTHLTLDGFDIDAGTLQAVGRRFNDMKVSGRRTGDEWRLSIDGKEASGNAIWQTATPQQPNGRVLARLARLTPPPAGDLPPWAGAGDTPARTPGTANPWPAIDIASNAFFTRAGNNAGKLEVLAHPAGADWQIEKLSITNDAGRIDAEGFWRGGRAEQTKLDVKVDVQEAGAFLAHFNMPGAIRGAPTTIEGQLAWAGSPSDFDYPSLAGTFNVKSGAGQFLKADPGVGRLLGVLSLQALPRRITLDFRDVFSEGFAFDSVQGMVRIQNGVMHTDALKLAGPAAAVDIAGDVDLARETQQLRVRVQPALSSGFSAGAAALFIANPLIGAAVGAGTLLAQKMLNNPIEQLFSYEYAVSGGWDDPVVQRIGARTAAAAPPTVTK